MLCPLLFGYLCICCAYENDLHHSIDLVRKMSQVGNVYFFLFCGLSPAFLKERSSDNAKGCVCVCVCLFIIVLMYEVSMEFLKINCWRSPGNFSAHTLMSRLHYQLLVIEKLKSSPWTVGVWQLLSYWWNWWLDKIDKTKKWTDSAQVFMFS